MSFTEDEVYEPLTVNLRVQFDDVDDDDVSEIYWDSSDSFSFQDPAENKRLIDVLQKWVDTYSDQSKEAYDKKIEDRGLPMPIPKDSNKIVLLFKKHKNPIKVILVDIGAFFESYEFVIIDKQDHQKLLDQLKKFQSQYSGYTDEEFSEEIRDELEIGVPIEEADPVKTKPKTKQQLDTSICFGMASKVIPNSSIFNIPKSSIMKVDQTSVMLRSGMGGGGLTSVFCTGNLNKDFGYKGDDLYVNVLGSNDTIELCYSEIVIKAIGKSDETIVMNPVIMEQESIPSSTTESESKSSGSTFTVFFLFF